MKCTLLALFSAYPLCDLFVCFGIFIYVRTLLVYHEVYIRCFLNALL